MSLPLLRRRVPGISRRQFMQRAAVLAAALGLSIEDVAPTLAAEPTPFDGPSTLLQTVRQGSVQKAKYRTLTAGPGEPYLPRIDILGTAPSASRVANRRSLLYLGHLSDLHVINAQSPGRIEPMILQNHSAWGSAFHPQDPVHPHTVAAMVQAFFDLRRSPLTGAPMGAAVVTGDSADMHSFLELRWYIDLMDGVPFSANNLDLPEFHGVQAWAEAVWAYRPNDPTGGSFGDFGFPTLPKLLDQALATEVASPGLPAPWYAVYGNHDTLLLGTFNLSEQLHAMSIGTEKSYTLEGTAGAILGGYAATSPLQRAVDALGIELGRPGFKRVPADPERFLFQQRDFMAEHFNTQPEPGPVGHGFTQHNLDSGETWWKQDLSPNIRAFGLDTCNQVAGPDGAVPDVQFQWLRKELEAAQAEQKLCLILSHHNSLTLENDATRPGFDGTLHHAEEFVAMLLEFPAVIGWLNGHTHLNQILAHKAKGDGGGGFWEITTASCIDFPQQQQVVEIVDNRDGTLSLFTTVLDHASPATPGSSGSLLDLASQARELAANDWAEDPMMRRGSPLDRNTELLLKSPFDLSRITDAALEAQHMTEAARLVAHEQGLSS